MDIDPNDYDFDLEDHFEKMAKVVQLLQEIGQVQTHMRWQFGDTPQFTALVNEIDDAKNGWIASNC